MKAHISKSNNEGLQNQQPMMNRKTRRAMNYSADSNAQVAPSAPDVSGLDYETKMQIMSDPNMDKTTKDLVTYDSPLGQELGKQISTVIASLREDNFSDEEINVILKQYGYIDPDYEGVPTTAEILGIMNAIGTGQKENPLKNVPKVEGFSMEARDRFMQTIQKAGQMGGLNNLAAIERERLEEPDFTVDPDIEPGMVVFGGENRSHSTPTLDAIEYMKKATMDVFRHDYGKEVEVEENGPSPEETRDFLKSFAKGMNYHVSEEVKDAPKNAETEETTNVENNSVEVEDVSKNTETEETVTATEEKSVEVVETKTEEPKKPPKHRKGKKKGEYKKVSTDQPEEKRKLTFEEILEITTDPEEALAMFGVKYNKSNRWYGKHELKVKLVSCTEEETILQSDILDGKYLHFNEDETPIIPEKPDPNKKKKEHITIRTDWKVSDIPKELRPTGIVDIGRNRFYLEPLRSTIDQHTNVGFRAPSSNVFVNRNQDGTVTLSDPTTGLTKTLSSRCTEADINEAIRKMTAYDPNTGGKRLPTDRNVISLTYPVFQMQEYEKSIPRYIIDPSPETIVYPVPEDDQEIEFYRPGFTYQTYCKMVAGEGGIQKGFTLQPNPYRTMAEVNMALRGGGMQYPPIYFSRQFKLRIGDEIKWTPVYTNFPSSPGNYYQIRAGVNQPVPIMETPKTAFEYGGSGPIQMVDFGIDEDVNEEQCVSAYISQNILSYDVDKETLLRLIPDADPSKQYVAIRSPHPNVKFLLLSPDIRLPNGKPVLFTNNRYDNGTPHDGMAEEYILDLFGLSKHQKAMFDRSNQGKINTEGGSVRSFMAGRTTNYSTGETIYSFRLTQKEMEDNFIATLSEKEKADYLARKEAIQWSGVNMWSQLLAMANGTSIEEEKELLMRGYYTDRAGYEKRNHKSKVIRRKAVVANLYINGENVTHNTRREYETTEDEYGNDIERIVWIENESEYCKRFFDQHGYYPFTSSMQQYNLVQQVDKLFGQSYEDLNNGGWDQIINHFLEKETKKQIFGLEGYEKERYIRLFYKTALDRAEGTPGEYGVRRMVSIDQQIERMSEDEKMRLIADAEARGAIDNGSYVRRCLQEYVNRGRRDDDEIADKTEIVSEILRRKRFNEQIGKRVMRPGESPLRGMNVLGGV